jgi:hypothetical protein
MKLRALTAALLVLGSAQQVRAQGSPASAEREALALAQRGLAARREGRDADALAEFERSIALAPRASVQAQRGFALQALGRWIDAERALESLAPSDDAWVRRHRVTIDGALTEIRTHLGWLELTVDPPGSETLVDGTAATSGERLRWPAGSVSVVVRREGYYPVERSVAVRPLETVRETIALRPRVPEAPPILAPEPVVPAPRGPAMPPVAVDPVRAPSWVGPTILGGAGLASLGVGVALWLLRDGALRALTTEGCVETAEAFVCDPRRIDAATARDRHEEATSLGDASPSLIVVGGAMVVAGAAWMLVGALQRGGPAPRAGLVGTPGGVRWSF